MARAVVGLVVLVLVTGCGPNAEQELAKVQGTWILVSAEGGANPGMAALRIDGEQVTWEYRPGVDQLEPKQIPYLIDPKSRLIKRSEAGLAGGTRWVAHGIWRVEDDKLKLSLSRDLQTLPGHLDHPAGRLYVFERGTVPWQDPAWFQARRKRSKAISDLGDCLLAFAEAKGPPPRGPEDLLPTLRRDQVSIGRRSDLEPEKVSKLYEVVYGVDLRAVRPEDDGSLLAWEKVPDDEGGRHVLEWRISPRSLEGVEGAPTYDVIHQYVKEEEYCQRKKASPTPRPQGPMSPDRGP